MATLTEPRTGDDLERDRLARASVLVLGDASLQRRIEGRFTANGTDTGATTLLLGPERAELGAGAAVVRALAALGVASAFVCVVGDDLAGAQLTTLIGEQRNVEPWLLVDGARATITETLYCDVGAADGGAGIVLRTLRQDTQPAGAEMRQRMVRIAVETLALTGVAVMTDHGHGTLDPATAQAVIGAARQAGRRTIADLGAHPTDGAHFAQVDVVIGGGGGEEADAHALRRWCDAGAAALFRPDGAIVLADGDGAVRFTCDDRDHAERVAVFAAALATGRTVRDAAAAAGRFALAAHAAIG